MQEGMSSNSSAPLIFRINVRISNCLLVALMAQENIVTCTFEKTLWIPRWFVNSTNPHQATVVDESLSLLILEEACA